MDPFLLLLLPLLILNNGAMSILYEPTDVELENFLENSLNEIDSTTPFDLEKEQKPNLTEKIENFDNLPIITSGKDETQVAFKDPIASVSIDYSKNVIILSFQKKPATLINKMKADEAAKRKAIESNFMRFGKREKEDLPLLNGGNDFEATENENDDFNVERHERSLGRNARGDNFMRFGRAPAADFMRFGRNPKAANFMRLGRAPAADFMRFGRAPAADFMRFGRAPAADFMRFGRAPAADFMRFGRAGNDNFIRFGRSPKDFMRLGRSTDSNFMRLGRNPNNGFLRFGRSQKTTRNVDKNFMRAENFFRFGRDPPQRTETAQNFMRFGKRSNDSIKEKEVTPLLKKSEILETAKVLHKSEEGGDESNPIDKAIKVLYKKHKEESDAKSQEHKSSEEMIPLDNITEENDSSYSFTD